MWHVEQLLHVLRERVEQDDEGEHDVTRDEHFCHDAQRAVGDRQQNVAVHIGAVHDEAGDGHRQIHAERSCKHDTTQLCQNTGTSENFNELKRLRESDSFSDTLDKHY